MKKFAKKFIAAILGWQVRRLRRRNGFKVVAVAGSIGKTSTKLAIARVLGEGFKVRFQDGYYNDPVSVPMVYFEQKLPNIFNPLAWLLVFWNNEKIIGREYPYEVVVLELGTDRPGDMAMMAKYVQADIGVLTSITPEHMQMFADLHAVAREELVLAEISETLFVNKDLVPNSYIPKNAVTYAAKREADVQIGGVRFNGSEAEFTILAAGRELKATHGRITEPQLYSVCAACAVALEMGMTPAAVKKAIGSIRPVNGRMQHLSGINGSTIIDDSYNASPAATSAALDTLYRIKAPQKIALLGNMNELGSYSQAEHEKIGKYCDPGQINLLLTLGPDANKYLAPAAEAKGCKVITFESPYIAGDYLRKVIKPGAVILIKGSQNGVFAEEAVKLILANSSDSKKLVRQSKDWLKTKQKAFSSVKIA